MIRLAEPKDIQAITEIYEDIHTEEEAGNLTIGWQRDVYPTEATASASVAQGDMFVYEKNGSILAAAKINREQVDVYADGNWEYSAPEDEIMVLHTLVVSPSVMSDGIGRDFAIFYENYAKDHDCHYLRIDTNERNLRARSFYKKMGYKEVGIVPCTFNGISGVNLVLLEKKV